MLGKHIYVYFFIFILRTILLDAIPWSSRSTHIMSHLALLREPDYLFPFFFWDNEKKHNGLPCLLVCCLPRGILSRKLILETRRRYSIFKVFSDNFANRWRLRFSGPIAGRGFINVLYFLVFRVIFTQIDIMWLIWRSGWHRVTFFVFSN